MASCNTKQSDDVTYEECVFVRVNLFSFLILWRMLSSQYACGWPHLCLWIPQIKTIWKGHILNKFIFICCYFTHVGDADEHNSNSSPKKWTHDGPNQYYYNQPTNQSSNQPTNQPTNKLTN